MTETIRKPDWIKVRLGHGDDFARVRDIVQRARLHTVCEEALCPNRGRCWEHGRATIMLLGDICTRGCRFCNVASRRPAAPDPDEPRRVAEAVREMGLNDVVLTSVTRDDLPDGGAGAWAATMRAVRAMVPDICLEVLVPDFAGNADALETVLRERPDVFGHNLETVPGLYPEARPQADYTQSLDVLKRGADAGLITKTALMLGLGESREEVLHTLRDARAVGCRIMYLGQYLQPSRDHLPVARYVEPGEFEAYRQDGAAMGFDVVVSAPLVRSSYHSDEQAAFLASAGRAAPGQAAAS